ncbi:MAG: glycosyltransferase family 39 protein [Oligoflexia bacterium]|nr:glycosyltransferase family 39 protein [Oligoflexia bacterium]
MVNSTQSSPSTQSTDCWRFQWPPLFEASLLTLAIVSVLPRLSESLWLDEFAVTAATSGSLVDAINFKWMGLFISPPYYALQWLITQALGQSEFALRALSFVCLALSSALTFRLARALNFPKSVAWTAAILLTCMPVVREQAATARPYTLSLTLCIMTILSTSKAIGGSLILIPISALLCSTIAYIHPLLTITPLIVLATFFLWKPKFRATIVAIGLVITIAISPLLGDLVALWHARRELYYEQPFAWRYLLSESWPLIAYSIWRRLLQSRRWPAKYQLNALINENQLILHGWCAAPPLLFCALAFYGKSDFTYFSRYLICTTPAFCILISQIFCSLSSKALMRACLIAVMGILCLVRGSSPLLKRAFEQDWRAISVTIKSRNQPTEAIALYGCWPETNSITRLADEKFKSWFSLPLHYYGVQQPVVLLPAKIENVDQVNYVRSTLERLALNQNFLAIPCYEEYDLKPLLTANGLGLWNSAKLGDFGMIPVYELYRGNTSEGN